MKGHTMHFRHILFVCLCKGKNGSDLRKKLCEIYGDNSTKKCWCQFDTKDAARSGQPTEIANGNLHFMRRKIAESLKVNQKIIPFHLKKFGYANKLDISIFHKFGEVYLMTNNTSIKRSFLKRMITGNGTWIVWRNVQRKWFWSRRKVPLKQLHNQNGRIGRVF